MLLKGPPFDLNSNTPHFKNVREYYRLNKPITPKIVYIYENGNLIAGSPFASFSEAHRALGLKSSSNTCSRYIDTDRLYKAKYLLTSKPIDNTYEVQCMVTQLVLVFIRL